MQARVPECCLEPQDDKPSGATFHYCLQKAAAEMPPDMGKSSYQKAAAERQLCPACLCDEPFDRWTNAYNHHKKQGAHAWTTVVHMRNEQPGTECVHDDRNQFASHSKCTPISRYSANLSTFLGFNGGYQQTPLQSDHRVQPSQYCTHTYCINCFNTVLHSNTCRSAKGE